MCAPRPSSDDSARAELRFVPFFARGVIHIVIVVVCGSDGDGPGVENPPRRKTTKAAVDVALPSFFLRALPLPLQYFFPSSKFSNPLSQSREVEKSPTASSSIHASTTAVGADGESDADANGAIIELRGSLSPCKKERGIRAEARP